MNRPAVLLALCLAAAPVAAASAQGVHRAAKPAAVTSVGPVGLTVSDMERSLAFYTQVLPFTVVADREVLGPEWEALTGLFGVRLRRVTLQLGDEQLELTEYLVPHGRPAPWDARSNDRSFQHVAIIVRDMDSAYAVLRRARVRHASTAPQLLPKTIPNAAGIRAFYFRDPDGHPLEILAFPPDKGDAKWHRETNRLFLGLDHTAIVVGSTAQSRRFYEGVLGIPVRGESLNFGTEQEHLNNVEGARLHITGLRTAAAPGIEFLEYLQPRTGRPYPAGEQPNDLVHWQTTLRTADLDGTLARLHRAGAMRISRRVASINGDRAPVRAVLVRDPDGHALLLEETIGAPSAAQTP